MASMGKGFGPWMVGRPDIVPFRRQRSSAARGSLQSSAHLKHRPSIGTNVNFSHLRPGLQNPMSAAPQCHTLRFAMAGSARA